jgi:hypothetical protein
MYNAGSANNITSINGNITASANNTVVDNDTGPTFSNTGAILSYGVTPTKTLSSANNSYRLVAGSGAYAGDYVIMIQPAQNGNSGAAGYDFNLPSITSSQCYNPQKNGNPAGSAVLATGGGGTATYTTTGDQNNGSGIDPVANPQLGAIVCSSNPPETYALYWNDLGTYTDDDLGYWNAVYSFTCPTTGSTTGGGPVTVFE